MGGQVQIRISNNENHVQIDVTDTGCGIHPDFLPYVFDRFRQADSTTTRSNGGLGLGLALVRHLVELHGGTISVASDGEGTGATFTILLPILERNSSDLPRSIQPKNSSSAILNALQVLVVDDDADTCELIAFALKEYGAHVTAAHSATEGLKAIAQSTPDLLISDIGMPEQDGYWLIHQVRALDSGRSQPLPAVALTAFATEEDRIRALQAGFQNHVPKPIEVDKLIVVVANLADLQPSDGDLPFP